MSRTENYCFHWYSCTFEQSETPSMMRRLEFCQHNEFPFKKIYTYLNKTASSLSFSSDFLQGECTRALALSGEAFSHARGHLRVSGVLLDGPRKKRDCS